MSTIIYKQTPENSDELDMEPMNYDDLIRVLTEPVEKDVKKEVPESPFKRKAW